MDIRPFGQGIGVRAAPNKAILWFHLEPQNQTRVSRALARHGGGFATEGISGIRRDTVSGLTCSSTLSQRLHLLSERGRRVFGYVAWLEGVQEIDARPNYFSVATNDRSGKIWLRLLPEVISLLRLDLRMPNLPVYPIHRPDVDGCDWHESLLTELFGPTNHRG